MAAVVALTAMLQGQPDFSGRWSLVSADPASTSAPLSLVVEQPATRTALRGEPAAAASQRISIRRETPSSVTTETHEIGVVGGVIGGVVAATGESRGPTTRFETVRLNMLTFLTRVRSRRTAHGRVVGGDRDLVGRR